MVLHATVHMSRVRSNRNMYESPSIPQSNPPSGTGHTVFGSSIPVQDGAHLGGLADESAHTIHSALGGTNVR